MADMNINVNVIEGGQSPTRNPENITSKKQIGTTKISKDQATSRLKQLQAETTSNLKSKIGIRSNVSPAIQVTGIGLAVGAIASTATNFIADEVGSRFSIRGADYRAVRLNNTMDKVNAGVGLGASIGAGALAGSVVPGIGTAVGAVVAGVGYIAKKAYDLASSNRDYIKETQVSKTESQYYSDRVRQDISSRR